MSGKTFNTRLVNKHDVEANWLKAVNFVPMLGEIIVYDVDDTHNYERFKIGDGKTLVSDLPFGTEASITIIDVIELPDENINESAFYRVPFGTFVSNQGTMESKCYIVESLPSNGEPITTDGQSVNAGYYNAMDKDVYGYLPDAVASIAGVSAGWYPFSTLAPLFGVGWFGVIGDISDCPMDSSIGLLLEGDLWYHQYDWKMVSPIGWRGSGTMAEVFNHPANIASGQYSHAEGRGTTASGYNSHAEGYGTTASNSSSHAEGYGTTASGHASHTEGEGTIATGSNGHAEGFSTRADGQCAHSEGWMTIAASKNQHVEGKCNIKDDGDIYAHIVGNGTSGEDYNRSNAHTIDWSGNAWFAGDVYVGSTSGTNKDEGSKKLATTDELPTKTSDLTNDSGFITTADIPEGAAASTTAPKMDGTAAVGTELAFARGDHVHPSDTSRVPVTRTVNGKALSSNITLSASDVNADAYGAASSALSSAKSYTDSQVAELKNGTVTVSHATNADEANHATSADIAGEADHAVLADNATNAEHATSADSATTAGSATKATQDGNGKVIATTYETKSDASAKLTEAKGYTDQMVGELSEGFDGVIRQMYADDITEDGAPTIREIAADEAGDALADAKSYADSKVASIDYPVDSVNGKTGAVTLTYTDVGAAASSHGAHVTYSTTAPVMDGTASAGSAATVARSDHKHPTDTSRVPTSRTVNGKALSANITLSASDVGADASGAAATALANAKTYADGKIEELTGGDVSVSHATSADSAAKATQDASGNVITTTYETKSDASEKLAEAKAYADDIKDDLLNGAGAAYDTLKELGDLIDTNADAIDALETVASGKANASHTHGNITNAGAIGTAANKAVITTTNGVLTTGTVPVASGGTGATTAAAALTNLGLTATAAELNIMDGVTATAAEINKLDGLAAKTAELNYVIGVTSNIQTQLNTKATTGYVNDQIDGVLVALESHATGHAPSNAEKNQNAFSNVTVGATTIAADTTTDTLTLVAGDNVELTPDATNDKITINALNSGFDIIYAGATTLNSAGGVSDLTIDGGNGVSVSGNASDNSITISGVAATTTTPGVMSASDKTKLDYTNVAYGTCATGAATAAKFVNLSGNSKWALTSGSIVHVFFSETNTASNPTLNVNSTGAKNIYYGASQITTSSLGYAGTADRLMTFVYDGTQYRFAGWGYDSNTTYTNVKLGHGYATCSTAAATTAKVGTLSSYTLTTGGIVAVKFTYAVPASATLNINSKGAKAIYHRGAAIKAGVIEAGDLATFMYNGSQYHLLSVDRDKDTAYTHPTYTAKSSGLYKVTVDGTGHVSAATAVAKADITALGIPAQDTTYSAASTSAAGLMSAADKTKLDGIATGATKITVDTALSSTSTNPVQNKVINTALAGKAASTHTHAAGDITSGTLAVARGGTGVTANPSMLTNLGSTTAASVFAASPRPGVTGTLPIANGGTGATTPAAAKEALQINAEWLNEEHNHKNQSINPSSVELCGAGSHGGYIDFHYGGDTGDYTTRIIESQSNQLKVEGTMQVADTSNTASGARVRNIMVSTTDLTAGTSSLATGRIWFCYE